MKENLQKTIIPLIIGLILVGFLLPVGLNAFSTDSIEEPVEYDLALDDYNTNSTTISYLFELNNINRCYVDFLIISNNSVNVSAELFLNNGSVNTTESIDISRFSNQTYRTEILSNNYTQIGIILTVLDSSIISQNITAIMYQFEPIALDSSIASLYYLIPIFSVLAIIFTIFMKKSKF